MYFYHQNERNMMLWIPITAVLSLSLLFAGCISTPPAVPTATISPPTATRLPATTTPLPPTATNIPPTATSLPPTLTSSPTPASTRIESQNAAELQVVNNIAQTEARSFTWLSQSESLALGTQQGVQVYSSPSLIQGPEVATGVPNFLINSPDQRELAWATQDNIIQLWNVASTSQPQDLKGNTGPVTSLAFSPDGQQLASASYDNQIFLWKNGDSNPSQTRDIPFWASNLSFSPDGTEIAGVNLPEFEIQIWKTATGEPVRKLT